VIFVVSPGTARHRRRDAASISEAILWTTVRAAGQVCGGRFSCRSAKNKKFTDKFLNAFVEHR